jgi:hypothetical protein
MQETLVSPQVRDAHLVRELGSMERLHWLMGRNYSNHFVMAAEMTGEIPDTWRHGLDELQRRHPLLNVCIARDEASQLVFRRTEGARIPLVVKERTSPRQWQAEFERELVTPFDAFAAPLMRAVLLRGNRRCEIILTTHHTIADGMSLVFVMRDLIHAVSGQKLAPLPVPPSQEALFAPLAARLRSPAPGAKPTLPPSSRPVRYYQLRPERAPRVRGLRLSQQQTSFLVERARGEKATVHAALCASLVLAGREVSPSWKDHEIRVLSPIATRKALNAGEDCALRINAGLVPFEPSGDVDLWDLARWAKQSLLPAQTLENFGVPEALQAILANDDDAEAWSQFSALGFGYDMAVTNVQRAPFANKVGDLTVKALWGPSALNGMEGEQAVAAATIDGSLCLVHTSYTPLDSLLEGAIQLWMKACGAEQEQLLGTQY